MKNRGELCLLIVIQRTIYHVETKTVKLEEYPIYIYTQYLLPHKTPANSTLFKR